MRKKTILVISGSPKKEGNTASLIHWFCEGAKFDGVNLQITRLAELKIRGMGCLSCRKCQSNEEYGCCVKDELSDVLLKMAEADAIVMATPLYFFGASAQLKILIDRMFSLYKWDNKAGTMETVLKGKTLALMASAFEDVGLKELEKPFILTADYTGMKFRSFLVPNAGESGEICKLPGIKLKASDFGKELASGL